MPEITELIEEELSKKEDLKQLRKDINELLAETVEYKCIYDSIIEMEGVSVSEKSAKAQALKLSYDHFKSKDE